MSDRSDILHPEPARPLPAVSHGTGSGMEAVNAAMQDVLDFWLGRALDDAAAFVERMTAWFGRDAALDAAIGTRFAASVEAAGRGALDGWAAEPRGALALVILLDQFPRNLFRGSPRAFAFDAQARAAARLALARGDDRNLPPAGRLFLYLPFEHAEDRADQDLAVALFARLAAEAPPELAAPCAGLADYARRHHAVIARFGRFPHRNAVLGRPTTRQEAAWLADHPEGF